MSTCYDAIGVFLCIHLNGRFRRIVNRRSVPALDRYTNDILWPDKDILCSLIG